MDQMEEIIEGKLKIHEGSKSSDRKNGTTNRNKK